MDSNYGGYVEQLTLNNGQVLNINKNDIVVFVGPNNSGKSQSLRDINNELQNGQRTGIVVKNIKMCFENSHLEHLVKKVCVERNGNYYFMNDYICSDSFETHFYNCFGSSKNLFVANLTTEKRLSNSEPVENNNDGGTMTHPLHFLKEHYSYLQFVDNKFEMAFEKHIMPDFHNANISVHIGDVIPAVNSSQSEYERQNEFYKKVSKYPSIQSQGDGMRSFESIMLELCLDFRRIYLFDEPEAFLHQPQARMVGQIIGQKLNNDQQCFIATHSVEMIHGLVDTAKDRLKIIRITRDANTNYFKVLNNSDIKAIISDSMLKNTEILSGVFYKNVVLCESDVDCLFYSMIHANLKEQSGTYSNTLFFRCGGKDGVKKAAKALLGLGVNTKCILDIDVLNDKALLKSVCASFGGSFELINDEYDILSKWINSQPNSQKTKKEVLEFIENIAKNNNNECFNSSEIDRIKQIIKKNNTFWDELKHEGSAVIFDPSIKKTFDTLIAKLKLMNVFVLSVGELEGFVPEFKMHHSYLWIQKVFEKYPLLDDAVFDEAKAFINDINL